VKSQDLIDISHYESASALLLSMEPAEAPAEKFDDRAAAADWNTVRAHLETRLNSLRGWRFSWIQHWALIAQYLNPRRSLWLSNGGVDQPVPNSMVRGLPINQAIVDPTATYASQVCAAGMMTGLMSPGRPWFKLKPALDLIELDREGRLWFEAVESIIYAVMSQSNFYDSAAQMFEDLVDYGTGVVVIYEDDEDIVRCQNPVVGQYYIAVSNAFRPETLNEQFVMTVSQIVEMFGLENCPQDVRSLWQTKGPGLDTERIVAHSVEPNFEIMGPTGAPVGKLPGDYAYRETFWVWGAASDFPLSQRGFHDLPFIAPRWWVTGNDPYGRSPAMTALGDIMQLQQETRRKAELLEKLVRPPMNAPVELKNNPSSMLPGALNFTQDTSKGMRPVYEMPATALPGITQDIAAIQARIKTGFFNDLFLMMAEATKDMTAYEVAQRQQEKLQVLGPVIERFQNEGASPAIERIFNILKRKRMLPPLPKSLRGVPWKIEYVSMLAMAQRAAATAGIERLLALQGRMASVNPQVLDLIDDDEVLREYGDQLGVTQKVFRAPEQLAQIRAQKAKQQQAMMQQQQMEKTATQTGPALAQSAQVLSGTPVGGGVSALQAMLGSGGGGLAPQGQAA
jgi:hypothetical protein